MIHLEVHRLLLCAILVASASEHSRLRAIVPSSFEGSGFSAGAGELKFDNLGLEAWFASKPFIPGPDLFSCYTTFNLSALYLDSAQRNVVRLRGPPLSRIG